MVDSIGREVLYYSNGFYIYNRENEIMFNGDIINYNIWWEICYFNFYIFLLLGLFIFYFGW